MSNLQEEIKRIQKEIEKHQKLLKDPELAPLVKEEIKKLKTQQQALEQSLAASEMGRKVQKQPDKSEFAHSNVILEIRAAAGGDEAKIWASDLQRMYLRFAQNKGLKTSQIDDSTIKIIGKNAFQLFRFESGVHRVQRVPITEKQGRIHTSTATVAVLPEITESQIQINPDDLEWQFTRAGGHGGQNVNKLNTAVRLTHKPSSLVISVRQERVQQQNKALALQILRSKLWQIEEEKRLKTIKDTRKNAVGRGMRAEKIRTYNFPQNRVTDHRLKQSWHNLEAVLDGELDTLISSASIAAKNSQNN